MTDETLPAREAMPARPLLRSLGRGAAARCPACGEGRLFDGFVTVSDHCDRCGLALHHHRADDAPPYFTMMIVGHVIVAALLYVEIRHAPPLWVHLALWLPLTILLSLALMRPVKGAIVALQWALGMHGFETETDRDQAPDAR